MTHPVADALFYAPVVVLVVWVAHVVESRVRPTSLGRFGWLLLVGLPVAMVVTLLAFGIADDPEPGMFDALPRGEIHDWQVRLEVLFAELLLCFIVVWVLEPILHFLRRGWARRD